MSRSPSPLALTELRDRPSATSSHARRRRERRYLSGDTTYGLVLFGLILPQIALQAIYFIPDPIANDVKYQGGAQPFLVFGILTTALAVGSHNPVEFTGGTGGFL